MSFRKKHKESTEPKEEDVKVSHAKDSQKDKNATAAEQATPSPQTERRTEQAPNEQSGQEADQSAEQDDEQTEEQTAESEEDEDSSASEPVPEGSTAEILRWVGGDKGRARRALDREQQDEKPRAGLTGELSRILG